MTNISALSPELLMAAVVPPSLDEMRSMELSEISTDLHANSIRDEYLSALNGNPPMQDSPYNRRVFAMGAMMRGRRVAFDMEGTLLDCSAPLTGKDGVVQTVQLKPGAEAFLAGFLLHNEVLLLTAAHAFRLAIIFKALSSFARFFMGREGMSGLDGDSLERFPRVFCYEDFISSLGMIADRAKRSEPLPDVEEKIRREVLKARVNGIKEAAHIKSRHLAGLAGKGHFDVLVDDDVKVQQNAATLREGFSFVKVPSRDHVKDEAGLDQFMDNTIYLIASALLAGNQDRIDLGAPKRLDGESPLRAKICLPPDQAFRPDERLDAVARSFRSNLSSLSERGP